MLEYLQCRTNVKQSFQIGLRIHCLIELDDLVEAVCCHVRAGVADHTYCLCTEWLRKILLNVTEKREEVRLPFISPTQDIALVNIMQTYKGIY